MFKNVFVVPLFFDTDTGTESSKLKCNL